MKLYNMDSGVLVQKRFGRDLRRPRRLPLTRNRLTRYVSPQYRSRFDDCPTLPLKDEEWQRLLNSISDDSLLEANEGLALHSEDSSGADELFAQLSRVRTI